MNDMMKDAVDYVSRTQPKMQKLAAFEAKVPALVDEMIAQGRVEAHMKSAKVAQLIEDPSLACDVARQVLTTTKVASLGSTDAAPNESGCESADDIFASRMMNG